MSFQFNLRDKTTLAIKRKEKIYAHPLGQKCFKRANALRPTKLYWKNEKNLLWQVPKIKAVDEIFLIKVLVLSKVHVIGRD